MVKNTPPTPATGNEAERKTLRDALNEGKRSGYVEDFNFDDFLARMNARYAAPHL